ncbi:CRISPR-associated protein, Csd1 family [Thiomonas sp. X19]|uniref:CRISPR-associated protein, Csd1 family protein n=1 Tax=mine drainage metagenome TaxID=410659 RepID=E6PND2_9ZZZZ|nr:type I-C CRISPR-associated protein Cas8c/Csd1 [Thiomonas sp. X19]SCC94847.1 CRISPR-associated protein, Csd1 family [Thiomonas sp. X19]
MILQALDVYYRRKQIDPDPANRLPSFGLEDKEIPFVLDIDAAGRLLNIADTRSGDGKKKAGQRFLVPQGVKKTSGVAANLLWDNAEYVLGMPDAKKREESRKKDKEADYLARLAEMHQAFRARLEALPESAREDAGIQAVLAFLDSLTPESLASFSAFADIEAANPVLSFRLHGNLELVCQRPAVVVATANQTEETPDGVCLVSGAPAAIERLHPAIKGVWGAQTSGANIVSFNLDAFNSYGKAQGANAPLGKSAVFAYTTALNHLLARDSRQRIQVGNSSTVFWAEGPHTLETAMLDLFGEPPKDNPDRNTDAIKVLYASVASGQFSVGGPDTRFHVLGLAPNAARISIRFWETATAAELARRIRQHFEDVAVVHAAYEPEHLSLFRLLTGLALLNKADNIPPNLGGEVMRAILEGLPYPATLLNLAVARCRAEQKPTYARAAVIKACLNRWIRSRNTPEKEFTPMLDPTNTNPAYRLGRLFATLEKIQEDASPGINATIRDRYYGAASSTPAAVFPTLLRLSKHHLGKMTAGLAITRERLIGEIMDGFDAATFPPRILPLPDQARFALGYYQQRRAFFTKSTTEQIQ